MSTRALGAAAEPDPYPAAAKLTRRRARRYDGAVMHDESPSVARVSCPRCRREVIWHGNPHRPFCSLSCRLVDLGAWLDEAYRIPGPELPTEPSADDGAAHGGE